MSEEIPEPDESETDNGPSFVHSWTDFDFARVAAYCRRLGSEPKAKTPRAKQNRHGR